MERDRLTGRAEFPPTASIAGQRPIRRALGKGLRNLSLLSMSLFLCLAVLEIAVRMAGFRPLYSVYSEYSFIFRHDPILGWSHQPNKSDVYVGPLYFPIEFRTPIQINSLGFRGPEITPVSAQGRRILVLGDSAVAGFEVAYENTFSAVLERGLRDVLGASVQVINGGVRGYGTDQSYLSYLENGRPLRPDIVVFRHNRNDVTDNVTMHRLGRPFGKNAFALRENGELEPIHEVTPRYDRCSYVIVTSELEARQTANAGQRLLCWWQMKILDHSAAFTLATFRLRELPYVVEGIAALRDFAKPTLRRAVGEATGPPHAVALTNRLIRELGAAVRSDGSGFIITGHRHALSDLDIDGLRAAGVTILAFDLDDTGEDLWFKNDPHFNEIGHQRTAEALLPTIVEMLRGRATDRPRSPRRRRADRPWSRGTFARGRRNGTIEIELTAADRSGPRRSWRIDGGVGDGGTDAAAAARHRSRGRVGHVAHDGPTRPPALRPLFALGRTMVASSALRLAATPNGHHTYGHCAASRVK